jgi:LPS sulfotransferase NodH
METAKPIIVISQQRSGSNLLEGYLNQIPGIVAFNEIFRPREAPGADPLARRADIPDQRMQRLAELQQKNRAAFWRLLQRMAANQGLRPAPKIFYDHVSRDNELWTAFETAKILHLVRENVLAAAVSRALAARFGKWKAKSYQDAYDAAPIVIPRRRCEALLAELEADIAWTRKRYGAFDYRELRYTEIEDIEGAQIALTRVLGEPVTLEKQTLARQRQRPLNEIVSNYAEVVEFDRDFPLVRPDDRPPAE